MLTDNGDEALFWVVFRCSACHQNDAPGNKYYARSPGRNPPDPENGELTVMRGGSWNFASEYLRTTSRMNLKPIERGADIGIRCARSVQ
jgi:formylglycine-generating enzyme required for sulfatase activity